MTRIIMPQQITPRAPIGSLLKRPRDVMVRRANSRPARETDSVYLDLIRQLPCLRCGLDPCNEAAHVRMNSAALGKRQAMQVRPDDKWAVPLCRACHLTDPDAQHRVGEHAFWHNVGLNPLHVCQDLMRAAPDAVKMRAVVFTWIAARE